MSNSDDQDYPPSSAYLGAALLGVVVPVGIGAAFWYARRWPRDGFRWGVWSALPFWLLLILSHVYKNGMLLGLVEGGLSPFCVLYFVLCCVAAWLGARGRHNPREAPGS